jgi:hypothetical protein
MSDGITLQKFANREIDAVVEAAEDGGVGYVGIGRGVEMEDLAHSSNGISQRRAFGICGPENVSPLRGLQLAFSLTQGLRPGLNSSALRARLCQTDLHR